MTSERKVQLWLMVSILVVVAVVLLTGCAGDLRFVGAPPAGVGQAEPAPNGSSFRSSEGPAVRFPWQ